MSTTGFNLFKIYDNVYILGTSGEVKFYNTSVTGTDDIERWVKATYSFEEELIEYVAQLTRYKQYYSFGFRPTITLTIKIVNSDIKTKVLDLISFNNNPTTRNLGFTIIGNDNKSDEHNPTKSFALYGMRLISAINPQEINDSVRVGEVIEFVFESKSVLSSNPILRDTFNVIIDNENNIIVDKDGNQLLGGFL